MGIFGGLFGKKEKKEIVVGAPARGKCVSITEVDDPTFGTEVLGRGIAILPEEGIFYAPADGIITMVFETSHAVSMKTADGAELLLHIGIDTVELGGRYFQMEVGNDQSVKKGDILVRADLAAIQKEGYDTAAMLVVCNTDDFAEIDCITGANTEPGDTVMRLHV